MRASKTAVKSPAQPITPANFYTAIPHATLYWHASSLFPWRRATTDANAMQELSTLMGSMSDGNKHQDAGYVLDVFNASDGPADGSATLTANELLRARPAAAAAAGNRPGGGQASARTALAHPDRHR